MPENAQRPPAPHVQAAIAVGQGKTVQPKVPVPRSGRSMAAHVQAAIAAGQEGPVQLQTASRGIARPGATHVQAAIAVGRGNPAQAKEAGSATGRSPAPHVQAGVALGRGLSAQAKPEGPGARSEVAAHVQAALQDPRPSTAQLKVRVPGNASPGMPAGRREVAARYFSGSARHEPPAPPHLGRTLQRMEKKIDVLGETQGILSVGRGNVLGDIKRTKGESLRRALATGFAVSDRGLRSTLRKLKAPEEIKVVLSEAIGGIIMKAGNCQEHAAIAFLLANRDFTGQDIILMSYVKDHAFVLVGDQNDLDNCVVIDVWDPSQNGKKYSKCSWYKKSKMKLFYQADGKDYIAEVKKELGAETMQEIHDLAYKKAEGQTQGIEKVTDIKQLEEAYSFSIYNF